MKKEQNRAFIDGQNLHLGIQVHDWKIDYRRFRVYLQDKYRVDVAYYFFGYFSYTYADLYYTLARAGFILIFKSHGELSKSTKKGNVDCDIIFLIMKQVIDQESFDKAILISGDGDYVRLVHYLMEKNKLKSIIFPSMKFTSSLYYFLEPEYVEKIENLKIHIERKKGKHRKYK